MGILANLPSYPHPMIQWLTKNLSRDNGGLHWFTIAHKVTLVTIGLLALLVAPNIGADSMEGVEKLLIVRGLRLLRLVRALRTTGVRNHQPNAFFADLLVM